MESSRNIPALFGVGIVVKIKTRHIILGLLPIITLVVGFGGSVIAQTGPSAAVKNIVLVHDGPHDDLLGEFPYLGPPHGFTPKGMKENL
jgi:hypothetical protein